MADAFQPKFVDLVRNITTTTGTANFTLGPAASGFTSFTAACAVGDRFYYSVVGIDKPGEREVGRGTLLAGNIVSREPLGGVKTNFSSGSKSIALIAASEWYEQAQQVVANVSPFGQALTASTTAAAARDALGIGSAGVEAVSRFLITVADRGALAAYSASSTAFLNESGRDGLFVWDGSDLSTKVAADTAQGIYVARNGGTGSSGAWVRKFTGAVNPEWFGIARGDAGGANGTANSAAFQAMIACLSTRAHLAGIYYRGLERIRFPSDDTYEFAGDDDIIDCSVEIEGSGPTSHSLGTRIKFPAGKSGFRFQYLDSSGLNGTRAAGEASSFSILRNLRMVGGYGGSEGEYHGIVIRSHGVILDNVWVSNFEGDGIYSVVAAGGTPQGNANNCRIIGGGAQGCRNGLFIDGADTNIWTIIGFDSGSNRRWNIWDSSFLGNSYFGCHTQAGGLIPGSPPSVVSYSGNRYCVKKDQGAGASLNAPSGTTADNNWWYYMSAGGVSGGNNIDAWTSGTIYRDGGAYRSDGGGNAGNVFSGCYAELGQGFAQIDAPALVTGKSMVGWTRGVAVLTGELNGLHAYGGGVTADGSIKAYGTFHGFGPQSGTVADQTLFFDTTNSNIAFRGRRWASGVASDIGAITYTYGFGMFYDTANATWAHTFRINGASTVAIKSTGIDLQAGKILSLAGTPLIGPRKTGWALDTGTAKRTANATYVGAAEATYTQATVQALMDAVRDLSQSMKALKDDLHGSAGHGLIGT
jgi:hypothetical protein